MGCSSSKSKKDLTKEAQEILKRYICDQQDGEEEGEDQISLEQITAAEKSGLIVESNPMEQIKTRIKTQCFQPDPSMIQREEAFTIFRFKSVPSSTVRENDSNFKNIGRETRTRYKETSSFPYSVHGILKVDIGNGNHVTGTGILIGPDLVLTAAHNLYDIRGTKKKYPDSKLEFIPGINDQYIPFGRFGVISSYVPDEYTNTLKEEDYALLVLNGTPGIKAGYFGFEFAEKELLKGKELNIIGYPGYVKDESNELKMLAGEEHHQLWGMKGTGWFFEENGKDGKNLIGYKDILTTPGQSGSGVFYQNEGTNEYYVVGVHVLGRGGEGCWNSATWITRKRFDQIVSWIEQSKKPLTAEKVKISTLNLENGSLRAIGIEVFSKKQYANSMIESINLAQNHIIANEAKILSKTTNFPNIEKVNLSTNSLGVEGAAELSQNNSWQKLKRLYLSNNDIGREGVINLSKNNSWTNLTILDLSENRIGDEGANGLSQNTSWTHLKTLYLSSNNIGGEGAKVLSQNKSWTNLKTLDLSSNNIGVEGAKALSENKPWEKLTTLYLSSNNIGVEGATALSKNNPWTNLTTLYLSSNNIGVEGAKALSENKPWEKLTTLDLSSNNIGVEGATALSENKPWTNLTTLNLSSNNIDAEGAAALSKKNPWTNLTTIYLLKNNIGIEGAKALSENESWKKLTTLDLSHNLIRKEGAKALSENKSWEKLTTLDLSHNSMCDLGAEALSGNKLWTKLTTLDLSHNSIGVAGAIALSKNKSWEKLTTLNLSSNNIGVKGKAALIEKWQGLNLK